MTFASLVLNDRTWIGPAIGVCFLAGLLLWWSYRRVGRLSIAHIAGLTLKAIGIVLLAICLVDPLWSGTRARPGANLFLLLVDNSESMQLRDGDSDESRGDLVRRALADPSSGWQARLAQDFDVRRYHFDSRLKTTADPREVDFSGKSSSLMSTLGLLRERFAERPVAGMLVFTDGNATDFNRSNARSKELPPIFPVVSDKTAGRDLAIERVAISRTAFEDAPVTIRGNVRAVGANGKTIVAELVDENDQVVERRTKIISSNDESSPFRFELRPDTPGLSFYRIRVATEDGEKFVEATTANNERIVAVGRGGGPHRILYVSGRPNWEYKFLARALADDDQLSLSAMIRIAKREPKFDWRSREGESSNPLFRGFKKDGGEEAERYDEPVIVRLNMKNAAELRSGFPKKAEDLYGFKAIVIDDLEAEAFSHEQMELIRRFVSERGGGLLMLGGQESFRKGGYRRTPVSDLLPVYLDKASAKPAAGSYRFSLTRDGWLQPWVRLRPNEKDEKERLAEMPGFKVFNRGTSIKPGAVVLAEATDGGGNQLPALVAHRFGRGRSAALTIGDLWRWQLRSKDESDDHAKAWRQLLRWVVADVPQQVDVQIVDRPDVADSAVALRVHANDAKFAPLTGATVKIRVTPPDGKPVDLEAEPSLDDAGLFEAVYVPRQSGAFRVAATVEGDDGEPVGEAETGWVADPAAKEHHAVAPNPSGMQELAESTNGELIEIDALDEFVAGLPARDVPITENWTYPLWHQPWVFLLAICCFAGEWGLRRWKGLP